jgi:hypothetical protein
MSKKRNNTLRIVDPMSPADIHREFWNGCGNSEEGRPWECPDCFEFAINMMMKHRFTYDEAWIVLQVPIQ